MSQSGRRMLEEWREASAQLGRWGIAAVAAAALALVVLIAQAPALARAVFTGAPVRAEEERREQERVERFRASFEQPLKQIAGRSMFFVPQEPAAPAQTAEAPAPEKSSKPSRYAGPGIIAMINGTVWFDDGKRLTIGADPVGSLKVIDINAPWSARLEWEGVEFEVPLFERTTPRFLVHDDTGQSAGGSGAPEQKEQP